MRNVILLVMCVVVLASAVGPVTIPAPPVLLDSGVAFVRPGGNQAYPSAAFDGTNWLVVWEDKRGDREAIWGARVNSAGVLLDSGNILIADDADARYRPSVAFNGTCYLVVWHDNRNLSHDIYGARVSTAGVVLDPEGIPICTRARPQRYPAVAAAGGDFLVVWQDNRNTPSGWDIYGARVSSSGTVLDTSGIPIATAQQDQEYPQMAFNGTNYLVVWSDRRSDSLTAKDVYAARVTTQGTVLDPQGIAVSTLSESQEWPGVASDGSNWLVVWEDSRSVGDCDIYGARVSGTGTVLDPTGIPVVATPDWQEDGRVAFDGANYVVVWEDYRFSSGEYADIFAARVTPAGTVLDTGIVICDADDNQYYPLVVRGGGSSLVVWEDYRNAPDDPDIFTNRLSPSGAVLDSAGRPVCGQLHDYEQWEPALSFGGGNFLAVWRDARRWEGWWSVYGGRVSPAGVVLDPGGFRIAEHYLSLGPPAVAFGNSNHLVCWDQQSGGYREICAARVTPQGAVLDTIGIYTRLWGYDAQPPAVAFDGTNWLVVAALKYPGQEWNILGIRMGQDGRVVDSNPIVVSQAPREQERPAVAFGTTSYLAVWSDFRSNTTYDIYGARIAPDGTVLDPAGIPISTAARQQVAPSVAFDGTNWLVAWQDNRGGLDRYYYYTRVSQSGIVLDTAGIPLGWRPDNYEDPLQMVFDGTDYFVVWQNQSYSNADLWGARINPQGVILDSFPVFAGPECQHTPAIALGSGNQVMVVYSGFVDGLRGYPLETMRIWAGIYPFYGIGEGREPMANSSRLAATIVRAVLFLPSVSGGQRSASGALLDISGKKVMELQPGPNDIQHLSPGIYFVRPASGVERSASSFHKVVVTR